MKSDDKDKHKNNWIKLQEVDKIISDIKFGSVTLIIQDGVLIQIEKNEKIRFK